MAARQLFTPCPWQPFIDLLTTDRGYPGEMLSSSLGEKQDKFLTNFKHETDRNLNDKNLTRTVNISTQYHLLPTHFVDRLGEVI